MRFSINNAVAGIIILLFVASLVSLYFATLSSVSPLLLVTGANIIAVIFLTFLVTRGVVRPLQDIQNIIKLVGGGDYTNRIHTKGTKEMEELRDAFNTMIDQVSKAQQEIQNINNALEKKVEARTRQLQDLATSLEEKVTERTASLEEKVDQLERFEKMAVGRELRMVELKEEIQKVQRQVNQLSVEKQVDRHDHGRKSTTAKRKTS